MFMTKWDEAFFKITIQIGINSKNQKHLKLFEV